LIYRFRHGFKYAVAGIITAEIFREFVINVQLARILSCVIFNVESFLYEHGVNLQKEINKQINKCHFESKNRKYRLIDALKMIFFNIYQLMDSQS